MFKIFRVRLKILLNHIAHQRNRYISDKNFLIIVALWVGILSGSAAVVLKIAVHFLQGLLQGGLNVRYENYLYLAYPFIGIFLCVLYVRVFHKKAIFDKGLSSIIYAISNKRSTVEKHKTYSHVVTAALSVGFGGSVGLEAPIAVTGSAIGANTAKDLLMSRQHRTLLLACGAAAGIAAIFNSPIAGVIFAFEVLLSEVSIPAFIPLLIASASGAVVSRFFLSDHQIFFLTTNSWVLSALPFYIILGAFSGLLSTYMIRMSLRTEHYFNISQKPWKKVFVGGIGIGIMLFFLPPLYGEGYGTISRLMAGDSSSLFDNSLFYDYRDDSWFIVFFVAAIILLKVFAAAFTIGAGGNGGIFGPALFTGALSGFLFSRIINLSQITTLNEQNFVAVAMCGLISGALHAPLTAIFLIAEITGGYMLFIPLMVVSAMSYFVTRYFEPNSIYKKTLIERGFAGDDKDRSLLQAMDIRQVIEVDFLHISPEDTLRQLVDTISRSKRNLFPVLEKDGSFQGIITLDDLKEVMFKTELYDRLTVKDLMYVPDIIAYIHDDMEYIMRLFEENAVWNIPILEKGLYKGFISKTGILNYYRNRLIIDEQTKRV